MEMIKTQDLAFTYPGTEDQVNTRALRGVDVTIERGSFVVILGHNGSGKSTLAKTFNAVLLPSGGKVYVEGMDTMDESLLLEIRRRVGMVFQNPDNQIVANVVEEDVAFAPENLGVPSAEIRKRVDDALEAVGMTQFVKHAPHLLSGGQKQRIAIAGVLAMKPECIVLDEATAMLDPIGRREVLAAVEKLNREQGITVVLITHHMNEAEHADRVIVMNDGLVVMDGKPREVFTRKKEPFCRSAVQDMSLAIYRGEFLGIIGHTGSGKSTLIQHLNGLLKPTSGRILLGGEDIWADPKKIRDVRFRVGLVFQYPEYQLFEETVYRDIAFGPTNMGLSKDEIDRRVRESAHFAGVTDDLLEKSPFALSGGQKRRVAIAGVIAMEPEVLVLDEPSAGLDPQGREELLANIREFHRARGTTVVLVSHSMEEIAKNVDRIVVLSDSHVLMSGTPREVFARGDELMTAGLDVPQVTRVAMALRDKGIAINPAVYTVDELSKELVALKRGGGKKC